MVLFGIVAFDGAVAAVDFHTIGLLLGMMVLVSALKEVGFFQFLAVETLSIARTPKRLLIIVVLATAAASAFFVNDAVVLLFTPIVIQACRARRVDPVPYLIAEAMASNIGSTTTIVGNPQNMLIGITAGISFTRFFLHLLPVAAISLVVLIIIMFKVDKACSKPRFDQVLELPREARSYDMRAILRLSPVLMIVMVGFFISAYVRVAIPLVALAGAFLVLLVGRAKPSKVVSGVDWLLLLFFASLFVVIAGANRAGVLDVFTHRVVVTPGLAGIASIEVVSLAVSQLVSNVPLTMLLIPMLQGTHGDVLWIALAAGSTLGGNLTIIGAVANIIVVEGANREGVHIGFGQFFRIGVMVTLITVAVSLAILSVEFYLGWLR